jgi:hypothetical protein
LKIYMTIHMFQPKKITHALDPMLTQDVEYFSFRG